MTIRDGDAACIMDWSAEAPRVPAAPVQPGSISEEDLAVAASQLLEGKQHADLEHAAKLWRAISDEWRCCVCLHS